MKIQFITNFYKNIKYDLEDYEKRRIDFLYNEIDKKNTPVNIAYKLCKKKIQYSKRIKILLKITNIIYYIFLVFLIIFLCKIIYYMGI